MEGGSFPPVAAARKVYFKPMWNRVCYLGKVGRHPHLSRKGGVKCAANYCNFTAVGVLGLTRLPSGINTAGIETAQNLGFAIPVHFTRRIIPDLIEMGHPYRPRLGFNGSVITPSIARLFGLPLTQGFLVEEVLPNSQAASAGLRAGERVVVVGDKPYVLGGDIITAINGQPFTAPSQIAQSLLQSHPGQVLRLTVYRQGRELEIAIPLRKMQMQF